VMMTKTFSRCTTWVHMVMRSRLIQVPHVPPFVPHHQKRHQTLGAEHMMSHNRIVQSSHMLRVRPHYAGAPVLPVLPVLLLLLLLLQS
jgi:hypothetical protein